MKAPSSPRPPVVLALLAAVLFVAPAPGHAGDAFKERVKEYDAYLRRPSLRMRHRGREKLARTAEARALDLLAKGYARPEEPKDQVQYLIASVCAEHFRGPDFLERFAAWRRKHPKPVDAWLWYRTLDLQREYGDTEPLLDALHSRRPGPVRAAALEALAARGDPAVLPVLTELLAALPVGAFDRSLLLESAATALARQRGRRGDDAWRTAVEALIGHLESKSAAPRTRLILARSLGRMFAVSSLETEAGPWLARLRGEKDAAPPSPTDPTDRYTPPKRPHFLGIDASGGRIAYVIDMSDSMLTPLTAAELADLKGPPAPAAPPVVTGDGKPAPPIARPRGFTPGADTLPWDRILTRFDAAREFLKLSLRGLEPTQSFCVIYFGTEAGLLERTPGMRPATPATIDRVAGELDDISAGPPTRERPHGTLRGYTNLHGGLHRAFKVKERGLAGKGEYVDPVTFTEGCDTLFLFSDGQPTWDDWPEWDTFEAEDTPGDPESGAEVKRAKKGHFYGPYGLWDWLLDDVRRLNLFRKVEIHCVGLGEYDPRLLERIARTGNGTFRRIPGK